VDYLEEKEVECLSGTQREIYEQVKKKAVFEKYSCCCILEYICPICGSDLNDNNVCSGCNSAFSIVGKKLDD